MLKAGESRFAVHVDIDFKILEGLSVAHQPRAQGVVFHILQRSFDHQHVVGGQHRILPGMERQPDVVRSGKVAAPGEQRVEFR